MWHNLCPKMETDDLGGTVPLMVLARSLDDLAGRQRVYVCPKCEIEVSVNYPPSSAPASGVELTTILGRLHELSYPMACDPGAKWHADNRRLIHAAVCEAIALQRSRETGSTE